jgi:hypothetical protein
MTVFMNAGEKPGTKHIRFPASKEAAIAQNDAPGTRETGDSGCLPARIQLLPESGGFCEMEGATQPLTAE